MSNRFLLLLLVLSLCPTLSASPAAKVLVTIKPLHSLVSGVMQGIAKPELLIESPHSLHHLSLKPSQRRALSQAKLIFWTGPSLEAFMPSVIASLQSAHHVALSQSPGMTLLAARDKRALPHAGSMMDPHIWLNTLHAQLMVEEITRQLSQLDPVNQQAYEANRNRMLQKITELSTALSAILANHKGSKYIAHHDSLQYFEQEFGLNGAAFISDNSDTPSSAQHIQYLRLLIKQVPIHCVLYDSATEPTIMPVLVRDQNATAVAIDTFGSTQAADSSLWFSLMSAIAAKISLCLQGH